MGIQYELLHLVDSQNDLMIESERCSKILSTDWSVVMTTWMMRPGARTYFSSSTRFLEYTSILLCVRF